MQATATDKDGNTFSGGYAISFTQDDSAPITASVTTPTNGAIFRAATVSANFAGMVADNTCGVGLNANSTTFTLRSSAGYWNGSAWQLGVFNLPASNSATTGNATATWTSIAALPTWASTPDGIYTIQATATDKAGNVLAGSAVSFTLDDTAPAVASVATPSATSFFQASAVPATFSGGAADNVGGVGLNANSTTFTLKNATGQYWNGSTWQPTVFNLPGNNSATSGNMAVTWTSSATLPTWSAQPDGVYAVQATVTDIAGNAFTGSAISFTLDDTAPITASVTTPAGGNFFQASAVPATFSGIVADNTGGIGLNANSTTFTLQRSTAPNYWNGTAWQSTPVALAATNVATTSGTVTTWTSNVSLPIWATLPDAIFTIQATATEVAGNTFAGSPVSFNPRRHRPQHCLSDDPRERQHLPGRHRVRKLRRQRGRQHRWRRFEYQQHHVHLAERQRPQRRQVLERLGLADGHLQSGGQQQRDDREYAGNLDQHRRVAQLGLLP